ncbi:MAG: hypothetical protein ABI990_07285, partial [Actinomycetota bacterium]
VAWTFNFDYSHYILAGVIWMLGVCMILLAGLVRFSTKAIAIFGLVVIFAQQVVAVPTLVISNSTESSLSPTACRPGPLCSLRSRLGPTSRAWPTSNTPISCWSLHLSVRSRTLA